jgi:hypothetical protein
VILLISVIFVIADEIIIGITKIKEIIVQTIKPRGGEGFPTAMYFWK